jgi:biotin transport system substrate-specific component
MLGLLLGSRRAAAAVLVFLAQGAMGLPVFAHGSAGLAALVGPTGGYLFGYLVGAFAVGVIMERGLAKTSSKAFLALLAGNGIVYLLGASYLASFIGAQKAMLLGVAPFVIVDLIKLTACVKILQWIGWEKK